MEASKIQEIMKKLHRLSYQKILFNGPWGIGKTEHISKVIEDNRDIIYISLFGKNNIKQFYEELYYQLISSSKVKMQKALTHMEKFDFSKFGFSISVPLINDILTSIQKELSEKTNVKIIIDDLERKSDSLEIKEILGFIDSITKNDGVKIVLVASTENLSSIEKAMFDDYSEKSIDRIYEITKYSSDAPQNIMGENTWKSIAPLYITHKITNLRTLEKTKYFIKEVIEDIPEEVFKEKITKEDMYRICAAVIIFSVDHSKRRESLPGTEENPPNYIWHFILKRKLKNSMMNNLIPLALEWYETGDVSEKDLNNLFIQIDAYKESRPPIFMSDNQLEEEITNFYIFINNLDKNISLGGFLQRLDELASIAEKTRLKFNYSVDQVVEWVLRDSDFDNSINNSYFDLLPRRESEFINKVIAELKIKSVRSYSNQIISSMIINLKKHEFNDSDSQLVNDFKLLYDRLKNQDYEEEKNKLIKKMKDNEWLLPLPFGEITYEHWSYCHNILQCIVHMNDKENEEIKKDAYKFFNKNIEKSGDEIFKYRMKSLMKQYLD